MCVCFNVQSNSNIMFTFLAYMSCLTNCVNVWLLRDVKTLFEVLVKVCDVREFSMDLLLKVINGLISSV